MNQDSHLHTVSSSQSTIEVTTMLHFSEYCFYKAHFQVIQCHVLFSYTFKMVSQKCVIYLNNNCIGRPVIINLNIVVRGFQVLYKA